MNKISKNFKSDFKTNNKKTYYTHNNYYDEEQVSLRDIKRDQDHKKYRNLTNVLRQKDIDTLMELEDDYD